MLQCRPPVECLVAADGILRLTAGRAGARTDSTCRSP
jgi:hypothetical protein